MSSIKWRVAQNLEIKWWQNYLKNKDTLEYLTWKKNYWHQFLQEIEFVKLSFGDAILDAGCGPAGIFTILNEYDVTAIDPLLNKYEERLAIFDQRKFNYVEFQNCQIEELGFDKKFDFIFCLNAINHVNDFSESLNRLRVALKDDGQMIISTDVHRFSVLKYIFKWIPGDALHPHQMDVGEFEQDLNRAGFDIQQRITSKKGNIFNYDVWVVKKLRSKK